MNSNAKEPLIHLTKRGAVPVRRAIAIRIFAVVIALIVCNNNRSYNRHQSYRSLFLDSIGSVRLSQKDVDHVTGCFDTSYHIIVPYDSFQNEVLEYRR
jgi:hypothetical protein